MSVGHPRRRGTHEVCSQTHYFSDKSNRIGFLLEGESETTELALEANQNTNLVFIWSTDYASAAPSIGFDVRTKRSAKLLITK